MQSITTLAHTTSQSRRNSTIAAEYESQDPIAPTRVRWNVILLLGFASLCAYLLRNGIAAANTTIQKELQIDDAQMGTILAAFGTAYFIFQVPGGLLATTFGSRIAFLIVTAGCAIVNIWTTLVTSVKSLWIARFAMGVFQAGLTPISARVLKVWIPIRQRGMSSAVIAASMSVGSVITVAVTGALLNKGISWQAIFVAYSLIGFLWCGLYGWYFRNTPNEHTGVNASEMQIIGEGRDQSHSATQFQWKDLAIVLKTPGLTGLCVQAFFRNAGYMFFVTWFFAFLEYKYGIDKTQAGLLNSLPLFAVVVGSLSGGFIVDLLYRLTNSKNVSRSGTAFFALLLSGGFTLASAWLDTATGLSVMIAIGALFSGAGSPAAWAATVDVGDRNAEVVMGIMNMAGSLAGILLPWLLGAWFKEIRESNGDWDQVIYLHAAFYFAGAFCWLFVKPDKLKST